jgi:hypothetical protein
MSIPESILTDELAAGLACDPDEVREAVARGALSLKEARTRHAVVFRGEPGAPGFAVDADATRTLREEIAIAAAPHGGA